MTIHPLDIARAVIDNLQGNDPWFPRLGTDSAQAWADRFAQSGLPLQDLLAGVNHARAHHTKVAQARADNRSEPPEPFRPTPDLILHHAHAARREVLSQLTRERAAEMEMANHLLQDMGISPQRAHRLSRDMALAVELGRPVTHDLDPAEYAEFKTRVLAAKQAVIAHTTRRRDVAAELRLADVFDARKALQ